jgi:hypothetical protein
VVQNDDGTRGNLEGWYIWLESKKLLGVSRGHRIVWCVVKDFEIGLTLIANELRT